MSSSSMYFGFHQPLLDGFGTLPPQDKAVLSNMKVIAAKLDHLSSKLSQSNGNSEPQTTQDNHLSSSPSDLFPRRQFPEKLYNMLELADAQGFGPSSNAISWLPNGRAFTVRDITVFVESIVPLFFRQSKMRSFAKQLNLWGFKRLNTRDSSHTYCHECFVRGSPEELRFIIRVKIKSKSNATQKKPADLQLEVNEGQLQHREDCCTQVSLGSLSDVHVSYPLSIPSESLGIKQLSIEPTITHPTSQCLLEEPSFKSQVSTKDDAKVEDKVRVGISIYDPIMLALNESSIISKPNNMNTTCANQNKPADLPAKAIDGRLKHHEGDVPSQSQIPRDSLKSRRESMEARVTPSISLVGYPPSHYLVAEQGFKRQVSREGKDVPVGVLGKVDIFALSEGVPRDEFAEFIDHMIHLL